MDNDEEKTTPVAFVTMEDEENGKVTYIDTIETVNNRVFTYKITGYDKSVIEEKFQALFNAFQYGAPPHAGIAPGVDRMIMLLTDEPVIRNVIAFPMNSKAQDLLMDAPGKVTEQQLREIHIKVDVKTKE